MTNIVLAVVAHPDDEILGLGGTLARHADAGDTVHVLVVSEGATSRDGEREFDNWPEEIDALRSSAGAAAEILGCEMPRFCGLADQRLDQGPLLELIKAIAPTFEAVDPTVIYTHHGGDLNIDHRLVHQAVLTHCRPQPGTRVRAIYGAESVSSTEWASPGAGTAFVPTHFVDITAQLDRKMMALNCYESEMRPFPHARSKDNILALARTRGASVGVAAAEAFVTLRTIVT